MKAIVLVGGEGTRLRPLTYGIPKPMVPVLNYPFLEHTIAYLKKYRIKEAVLATSYLSEAIQGYFGQLTGLGVKLIYAVEDKPLGTAGAVKNAEQHLSDTFIAFNGDIFTDLNLTKMLAFHRAKAAKVTIALTRVENPSAYGVVETESDGRVRRFIEKPSPELVSRDQVTTNWINAGIYIIEPEVLGYMPDNTHYMFESGLFPLLLQLGEPLYALKFDSGYWLDMGTPRKYLQLNCDLLLSKARSALLGTFGKDEVRYGERCTVHPSAQIIGPVIIGSNCKIGQDVCIKGPVAINSDCSLAEGVTLETAVLWQGVAIGKNAVLRHTVVGKDTTISANATLLHSAVAGSDIQALN